MALFGSYRIEKWAHLREVLLPLDRWVFRGQGNTSWPLESSLERYAPAQDLRPHNETRLVEEFKRRAHHFGVCPSDSAPPLEWIALMRHHGAPTRLLDVTRSPYVAAFFALEKERRESSAIWAFDAIHLNRLASEHLSAVLKSAPPDPPDLPYYALDSTPPPQGSFVVVGEPPKINARMAAQQGLFLIPANVSRTTTENVLSLFSPPPATNGTPVLISRAEDLGLDTEDAPVFLKLELPPSLRKDAMAELRAMNITAVSLYPDLDGLGKSLQMRLALGELQDPGLTKR